MPYLYSTTVVCLYICFIGFYIRRVYKEREMGTLISNRGHTKWRAYTQRVWEAFLFIIATMMMTDALVQETTWQRWNMDDPLATPLSKWPPHDAHFNLFLQLNPIGDDVYVLLLLFLISSPEKEKKRTKGDDDSPLYTEKNRINSNRLMTIYQTWTLIEIRHCWWACIHRG